MFDRERDEVARMNATQLAYMGDAVYEVKIRQMLISKSEKLRLNAMVKGITAERKRFAKI